MVVPISLYRRPSHLRNWLRCYKPNDELYVPEYGPLLAAVLGRFFVQHADIVRQVTGGWEGICVVPSSSKPPPHPFLEVLECATEDQDVGLVRRDVLTRGDGVLGHRIMSDDAFSVVESVVDERILLVDDVYTTGARLHSAASAIHLAGGYVVAGLVMGRRINPEFNDVSSAVWQRQSERSFQWNIPPELTRVNDGN